MPASSSPSYRGRFAPSPTGPLHMGSLVSALASWLDARAQGGTWLVRIEDLDPPREVPGAARSILDALAVRGMVSDEPVVYQSARHELYEAAFDALRRDGHVYGCACSRAQIESEGAGFAIYAGTCRNGTGGRPVRAWRFRVPDAPVGFEDGECGTVIQDLPRDVGDFVVRRADGLWAYQLAVVVDDAEQRITHVVRGTDLLDNTPRQIALQRALAVPTPRYRHVPIVLNERGQKLSKQTGAAALDDAQALDELHHAAIHLGLPHVAAPSIDAFLRAAAAGWQQRTGLR